MNKLFDWFKQAALVLGIAGVWVALDQATKIWVRQNIPLHDTFIPFSSVGEYFVFEHVNNYGAAFGILQNKSILFVAIAVVVIAAILLYVRHLPLEQRFVRMLLGLQLGGAIGNLADRLHQGFVTDFIKMGVPGVYYWPNYNIADSGIVVGVIGLGIYILWDDVQRQRQAERDNNVPSPKTSEF